MNSLFDEPDEPSRPTLPIPPAPLAERMPEFLRPILAGIEQVDAFAVDARLRAEGRRARPDIGRGRSERPRTGGDSSGSRRPSLTTAMPPPQAISATWPARSSPKRSSQDEPSGCAARLGAFWGHGSGDIVLGFTTANRLPHADEGDLVPMQRLHDARIDDEATERGGAGRALSRDPRRGAGGSPSPASRRLAGRCRMTGRTRARSPRSARP